MRFEWQHRAFRARGAALISTMSRMDLDPNSTRTPRPMFSSGFFLSRGHRSFRSAAWIAALLMGLSCGTSETPGTPAAADGPDPATPTVPLPNLELAKLNDKVVLEALFPAASFTAVGNTYTWAPDPQLGLPMDAQGRTTTVLLSFLVGRGMKAMVFESFAPDTNGKRPTCHACAPMLSVAVFKGPTTGPWRLTAWAPALARHGQNGKAADVRILTLGRERQAMELSMVFRGAGQGSGRADFYDLEDLSKVLSVDTYSSFDHMAGGELLRQQLETTVSFLPGEKTHFDVELHTQGHRVDMQRNTRTAVDERVLMTFNGREYVAGN